MANLSSTIKLKLDSSSVKRGIKGIKRGFANMGKAVANIATGVAKFAAAVGVAVAAFAVFKTIQFFKDSSKVAADMETLAVSFEVLLGSASAATARMKELKKFSLVTPFTPKEVINASKLLQTLGGDLIATGDGLTMVGDAAAVSGEDFGEVALQIGRLFGAITSGTSAGEAVARLQELGLITGAAKLEFEELAKAQKKGTIEIFTQAQGIEKLKKVLGKTEGAMAKLAETAAGKFSTLEGNIDNLREALGTGLNEGLKVGLDGLNKFLPLWEAGFKAAGEKAGHAISMVFTGEGNMFGQIETTTLAFFDYLFAKVGEMLAGYITQGAMKGLWGIGGASAKGVGKKIAPLMSMTPGGGMVMEGLNKFAGVSNDMGKYDSSDFQSVTKNQFSSEARWADFLQSLQNVNETISANIQSKIDQKRGLYAKERGSGSKEEQRLINELIALTAQLRENNKTAVQYP